MIPALNLLSPAQKSEITRSKILLMVHEIALLLFIGIVLGSIALFGARMMLEKRFREVILEQVPGKTEVAQLNKSIHSLNQRITSLDKITSSYAYLSPITIKLAQYTPDGITWNAFRIEENKTFTLTGNSITRADLVVFIEALENEPMITNVDLPLQYLVQESDIDFTLQGTIDKALLNQPL
jgi:hypothetical protein